MLVSRRGESKVIILGVENVWWRMVICCFGIKRRVR